MQVSGLRNGSIRPCYLTAPTVSYECYTTVTDLSFYLHSHLCYLVAFLRLFLCPHVISSCKFLFHNSDNSLSTVFAKINSYSLHYCPSTVWFTWRRMQRRSAQSSQSVRIVLSALKTRQCLFIDIKLQSSWKKFLHPTNICMNWNMYVHVVTQSFSQSTFSTLRSLPIQSWY